MAQERSRRLLTVLALMVFLHLATFAGAVGVAALRERLLSPDTPDLERGPIVSRLLEEGSEGEAVLREVLRDSRPALAAVIRRIVFVRVNEALLDDALAGATQGELEETRSGSLVAALAVRAPGREGEARQRVLRAIAWVGGWEAVEGLVGLWKGGVLEAQAVLRQVLPREFPSPEAADDWVRDRRSRSFETVLADLVRPPARFQKIESELTGLRKEYLRLAREVLKTANAPFVATHYLASIETDVRKIGATWLKEQAELKAEAVPAVAKALTSALERIDEAPTTLREILEATRKHVAVLRSQDEGALGPRLAGIAKAHLSRPEAEVRDACVDLLGDLGDAGAIPALETLYESDEGVDAALRARIVSALMRIGDGIGPWATEKLREQLARDGDLEVDVTRRLVNLLAKRGDSEEAVLVLRKVLGEVENEEIRRRAAEALGAGVQRKDPAAIDALIEVGLKDATVGVRLRAAEALGGAVGSRKAEMALARVLREDQEGRVRQQAARSLFLLLGPAAGPHLAPLASSDETVAAIIEEAVLKALADADLAALLATARALLPVDPARAAALGGRIRAREWPDGVELAAVALLQAEALVESGDPRAALDLLDTIPASAPVRGDWRCLVRARALRRADRPQEAVDRIEGFLAGAKNLDPRDEVTLLAEKTRSLLASGRPEVAEAERKSLLAREDLSDDQRKRLEAMGKEIEDARASGAALTEKLVNAWLDGSGGEDALEKVRELGVRAHAILAARLTALADPESPETASLIGKLGELIGQDFGFADAETPEARAAARQKWLAFLAK